MTKVIILKNNRIRIVTGDILSDLEVDWSIDSLEKLVTIIEFTINAYGHTLPSLKNKTYKDLKVYSGSNHIDIIDKNVGSLGLLRIDDNFKENLSD